MPPQYESRLRTIKFAHYLSKAGYKVTVFASSIMHNMDLNLIQDKTPYIRARYESIDFVHINTINYKKSTGVSRIISDIQFHYKLCRIARKFDNPDLIVATTWPYILNPLLNYSKRKGIKYITEMLDVHPDNFVDFGLLSVSNPLMRWLYFIAKNNYRRSDAAVFSWSGYIKYIKEKKWDIESGGSIDLRKMFYINNGVDLNDFDRWKRENILDDPDLQSEKKKIIYVGSLRLVNNIMLFVKALEHLKEREDVVVLIYGNGCDRKQLIDYCVEHNMSYVRFKDKWIDPKYVPYILSQSYLNILNYTSSKFGKYGISSSKMFQYMASGKPVVCNINIYDNPIVSANIGVSKEFSNEKEYADTIKTILDIDEEDYLGMCQRARDMAKNFDYEYLTNKLINVIKKIEHNC